MFLYVHCRDPKDYQGRGAQDGHVDFHTARESTEPYLVFHCALLPQKSYGLFGTWKWGVGRGIYKYICIKACSFNSRKMWCVCVCVRGCLGVYVRVRVRARARVCVCVCVSA